MEKIKYLMGEQEAFV